VRKRDASHASRCLKGRHSAEYLRGLNIATWNSLLFKFLSAGLALEGIVEPQSV